MSERKVRSDTSLSRHGGIECLILNVELRERTTLIPALNREIKFQGFRSGNE